MWKYDHIDKTRQRLLSKNILDLSGETDESMYMYVRDAVMILATNNNPNIKVVITSDGGDTSVGFAIYDMLKNYPSEVIGEVNGFCRSIAVVILQGCNRRLANVNAKFSIHNVSAKKVSLDLLRDRKRNKNFILDLEMTQKMINEIYSRRSGKSIDLINKKSDIGKDMTAQEALALGLIDGIIING